MRFRVGVPGDDASGVRLPLPLPGSAHSLLLLLFSAFHSNHLFQASATARLLARSGGDLKEYFQHGRALLPAASALCQVVIHALTDKKRNG